MNIQEQIKKLKAQQSSVKKAKVYLKDLETKIIQAKQKISKIELDLNLKFEELEKLQNLKVKTLFSRVLVDKESQLEQKRQEYLEKFLEYKEHKKSVDFLLYEKKIVLDKIEAGKDLDLKLTLWLEKRQQELIRENPKSASGIVQLQVQIDKCHLLKREFYEAMIEGMRTKKHIATITTNLSKARTLRNFTFINENEKVYEDEKEHVDKALEAFYVLKPILRKFELELEDIYKNHGYLLVEKLQTLSPFTKKYYNFLINDWIIYEKINVAATSMLDLERKILGIINKLEYEEKRNIELLKNFEEKKRVLLEQI